MLATQTQKIHSDLGRLIGEHGIQTVIAVLTTVASDLSEEVTVGGTVYPHDPEWSAIAAQLSLCGDRIGRVLGEEPHWTSEILAR